MDWLARLVAGIDGVSRTLNRLSAWLLLAMVLVAAWNSVARYLGRSLGEDLSSNAYLELQAYLFGFIFLLAAPHALRVDAHVRVDVIHDRLSLRARRWIDLVGHLLLLLPLCVFIVGISWHPVLDSWRHGETSMNPGGLARYWIKTAIPIGFGFLALQGLARCVTLARALRSHGDDATGGAATPTAQRPAAGDHL